MKAAVVYAFDRPPTYETFPNPEANGQSVKIKVSAAALSPLSRSQASGSHYSSRGSFPFIPGSDGVGRTDDGRRVYFAFQKLPYGSMAEQAVSSPDHTIPIPDDLDDITAAALANPGMSSWAALTRRAKLMPGENVLINGATGAAGRLAIQIAKHLGAGEVFVTGKDEASVRVLPEFGADETVPLNQPSERLIERLHEIIFDRQVSVVLDYLWGTPAEAIISSIAGKGEDLQPRIRFVQIGGVAGDKITLAGGALRSSALELIGSGIGSLSQQELLNSIEEMFRAAAQAGFKVDTEVAPLRGVTKSWNQDTGGKRLVFTT